MTDKTYKLNTRWRPMGAQRQTFRRFQVSLDR